jgi:hypothetical protein
MTQRSLDDKLSRIKNGSYRAEDFIIADAKDGEMGFGVHVAGPKYDPQTGSQTGFKPYLEYQQAMRDMAASGEVDILLLAASTAERLTAEGLFEGAAVTPAVRLNDTSDIWTSAGSSYKATPSRPFRSANIGRVRQFADLGLYSMTFYNDVAIDAAALEAYAVFREEAEAMRMRHFLEVFAPAFDMSSFAVLPGSFQRKCRCF